MTKYVSDKIVGRSTDTKPTGFLPGAVFYEEDTRFEYLLVSGQWLLMNAGSTGDFYPNSNPSGFISTHNHPYWTGASVSGSQTITGIGIITGIAGTRVIYSGNATIIISGQNDYYPSGSNPSGYTISGQFSGAGDNTVIFQNNLIIISGTGGGGSGPGNTITIINSGLAYFSGISGGQAGFLDAYSTTGLSTGFLSIAYSQTRLHYYLLRTGVDTTTVPSVVRPVDFNSSTNAKVWQLQGFQFYNYAGTIEDSGSINGNINIDFNTAGFKTFNLNGNATFSGLNLGSGRMISFRISGVSLDRTITYPTKYRFYGAPRKSLLYAGTTTVMSWTCFGNTDSDVSVSY